MPLLSAALMNAALGAYVQTLPDATRLHAHLRAHELTAHAAPVEAELRALIGRAEDFLYGQPAGTKWDAAFNERFFQHLVQAHPWLSREAFVGLGAFGQWLNWHEGLGL